MIRTIRKENNEDHWAKFLEDAKLGMKEGYNTRGDNVQQWYLNSKDCSLMQPSTGGVHGVFEFTKRIGILERIKLVTAVTEDIVTVISEPY